MTHLKIELNNTTEYLNNDSVIRKICDIIDNDNLDDTSRLSGTIHISNLNNNAVVYDKHIDKINNDHNKCQDLTVSADNIYIWFEDPNVEAALKAYYGLTGGVKASDIGDNNVSWMGRMVFLNRENNPDPNSYGTEITSFNELSKLTNIKAIVSYLFNGCSQLRSIDLSNITVLISNSNGDLGHFAGCTSLTNLGNTTNIIDLGKNAAFYGCSSLSSFTLGPLITSIPMYCFYNCTSLTTINGSPQNLQTLGDRCFEGCSNLTNFNVDLSNLTTIGYNAFYNCSKLENNLDLSNVTTIGVQAFLGCSKLTINNFPKATTYNMRCFSDIKNLSITIPKEVQTISTGVFLNCSSLETVLFENNSQLNTISDDSFKGCNIEKIIFPDSLTAMGHGIFMNCSSLRYVVYLTSFSRIGSNSNFINVTNCAIIFKSSTPPTINPYSNSLATYVWNNTFGTSNCISNGQINSNANIIYVPDNCVLIYKNSFINDEQTAIAGESVSESFELFVSSLIRPLSDLSSDIRTELEITQADIDRVPNNS